MRAGRIWFYSPPAVSPPALPTRCAIWDVRTRLVVPGTDNSSPAWSGAAGSGWVACPYAGVTLPAADYKVTVFTRNRRRHRDRAPTPGRSLRSSPEAGAPRQRGEQMKKYSTASFGPITGMFALTFMFAALSSALDGWPPCQLYEVGKDRSMVK